MGILDSYDSYGPFFKQYFGQTKEEIIEKFQKFLRTQVGCPEHFLKDVIIKEII